jgi:hypothetical protein
MAQSHGKTAAITPIHAPGSRSYQGPFGRLFRNLPAWEPAGADEAAKIADLERLALEMVEKNPGDAAGDNETIPSGYTYFGQFVDHDLTFDPRSSLQKAGDPDNLENFRTPAFDLDCVYGRGPDDQPYMYDGGKFLIGDNGQGDEDLVRNSLGRAIIGDKRNDENIIVSQLQLVFLKFHNAVFAVEKNFEETQRQVRWHYQWVVIHDWLKKLCGDKLVDDILYGSGCPGKAKLCFYHYHDNPFMPVEFSVAAYRLGHSMIRGRYKINTTVPVLPTFDMAADGNPLGDFRGFRPLPAKWTIDWSFFLDFAGNAGSQPKPQPSRELDKFLTNPVLQMPDQVADPVPPPAPASVARSLAFRNLLRGWRLGLPSGQTVARRIGATALPAPELPLWRYILEEAMVQQKGKRLGEVGSRIVAETFIGLLAADPSSYYASFPNWVPTLAKQGKNFKLKHIVQVAGAHIAPPP